MATYSYRYRVAPDMTIRGIVDADTDEDATWKALDYLKDTLYAALDISQFTIEPAICADSTDRRCAHLDLHRTHVGAWTCEQCGTMVRFTWHKQTGRATATFIAAESEGK